MLYSFQLRSARSVIGIGVRDLGAYLGISRTTISKWENQDAFHLIRSKNANLETLNFFFGQYNIIFPDSNSVAFKKHDKIDTASLETLTRFQFRASRAALNLTQEQLGEYTNIQYSDISYLERLPNEYDLSQNKKGINYSPIKKFFKERGIIFKDFFSITLDQNNFQDIILK
jgi:transcriptional regulator with XRE-family HTH domain